MSNELLAAALGALLGAYLTYRFSLNLVKKQHALTLELAEAEARRAACSSFRAAFAPTVAFILIAQRHGTHDRPDVDAHIKGALLAHGAAVEMFRRFVPASRRDGYQQAWEKYRDAATDNEYERAGTEWDWQLRRGELLERNIASLLRFTDA